MRRVLFLLLGVSVSSMLLVNGAAPKKTTKASTRAKKNAPVKRAAAKPAPAPYHVAAGPWKTPTYADSTTGDITAGEDPVVRQAAVDALGKYNGSVVVADPFTGRLLAVVNQGLAYESGFQPCSAFKVVVGLAALTEGVIERDTPLRVYGRTTYTLTQALAHSNNQFFESLGAKLGFDRVSYYARLFGLGERATLDVAEEHPGTLPTQPPVNGGVSKMCSFGQGISLTPLQYAAALAAVANGGTLYYLQHPKTAREAANLVPRVKRHLDITPWIPDIRPGMMAAVEYGTAKRAGFNPDEPILGKTGTCTDSASPTHLGWFGSFNDVDRNKLVVVVLLTGGRPVGGSVAAQIAGDVYKSLSDQQFFAQDRRTSPVALVR